MTNSIPKSAPPISEPIQERARRIRHDLRAPLINIAAFSAELREGCETLMGLLQTTDGSLPSDFRDHAVGLLNKDLFPCIGFIDDATADLDKRIDDFTEGLDRHNCSQLSGES